jgi:integral membrane protein (TIGR01906 family)
MEKKTLQATILVLLGILVLSTSLLIYLSNIRSVAFNQELYEKEFEKYSIRSRFDSSTNLSEETAQLLEYLARGEGIIETGFFNEREKTHLVEVRGLFRLVDRIIIVTIIASALAIVLLIAAVHYFTMNFARSQSAKYFSRIIHNLLIGTGAVVDMMALFFGAATFFFSSFFINFHLIFFETDTWILDPATDNLIRMFPEPFFFDMFVRIILLSVLFATVLLVAGFVMKLGIPKWMRRD